MNTGCIARLNNEEQRQISRQVVRGEILNNLKGIIPAFYTVYYKPAAGTRRCRATNVKICQKFSRCEKSVQLTKPGRCQRGILCPRPGCRAARAKKQTFVRKIWTNGLNWAKAQKGREIFSGPAKIFSLTKKQCGDKIRPL